MQKLYSYINYVIKKIKNYVRNISNAFRCKINNEIIKTESNTTNDSETHEIDIVNVKVKKIVKKNKK